MQVDFKGQLKQKSYKNWNECKLVVEKNMNYVENAHQKRSLQVHDKRTKWTAGNLNAISMTFVLGLSDRELNVVEATK